MPELSRSARVILGESFELVVEFKLRVENRVLSGDMSDASLDSGVSRDACCCISDWR